MVWGGLVLAAGFQIMRFENVLEPDQRVNEWFDACYVPRRVHVTGSLGAHDVGLTKDGEVIFVNTRFNCLATPSDRHSFAPVWRPPFVSELVDEDRCHLNGLAMADGTPRYVTAVSRSDTIDGCPAPLPRGRQPDHLRGALIQYRRNTHGRGGRSNGRSPPPGSFSRGYVLIPLDPPPTEDALGYLRARASGKRRRFSCALLQTKQ